MRGWIARWVPVAATLVDGDAERDYKRSTSQHRGPTYDPAEVYGQADENQPATYHQGEQCGSAARSSASLVSLKPEPPRGGHRCQDDQRQKDERHKAESRRFRLRRVVVAVRRQERHAGSASQEDGDGHERCRHPRQDELPQRS